MIVQECGGVEYRLSVFKIEESESEFNILAIKEENKSRGWK